MKHAASSEQPVCNFQLKLEDAIVIRAYLVVVLKKKHTTATLLLYLFLLKIVSKNDPDRVNF